MSDKRGPTIEWTAEKRDRLHKAVDQQVEYGADKFDVFEFDGHKLMVGYAQYLLGHLDKKLEPTPAPTPMPKPKRKAASKPKPKPEPRRAYARSKGGR